MLTRLCFFLIVWTSSAALASGWVKRSGEYYVKVSTTEQTRDTDKSEVSASTDLEETATNIGLYVEYGAPTPWDSQLIFAATHKTINLKDKDAGDSFTSAALADSDLIMKHRIGSHEAYGVQFMWAANTGVNLPTTKKAFRIGETDERVHEAPSGRAVLVAPIDYGRFGLIYGLGVTAAYRFVWLSLDNRLEADYDAEWADHKSTVGLGFSLPFNSWIQGEVSQLRSAGAADSVQGSYKTLMVDQRLGLGITVFAGLALEASFTTTRHDQKIWKDYDALSFGVSYRSL